MLFAQTSDSTVLVAILAMLGGSGSVIAFLFRALIISKDREYALLAAQKDKDLEEAELTKKSYYEIATEAIKSATDTTNYYRAKERKPPLIIVAPVVPESHSPSTAKQREVAVVSTMRATLVLIKLETGQEPKPEPEHAIEGSKIIEDVK